MKRKIIKQGHNTLTITLPSKWATKNKVKAGDEIELSEKENTLVLTTEYKQEDSRVELDITNLSTEVVWRVVSSAYRAGHNEIAIHWEEKNKTFRDLYTAFSYNTLKNVEGELSTIEALQALVNRFVGMEIIDQKHNSCVMKELSESTDKEFDNSLRRIFLLLLDMAEECSRAIEGKQSNIKAIHLIDTNLDRFEDFCLRVLNTRGYVNTPKTSTMYTLIFSLELLGDEFKKMSLHLLDLEKNKKNITKTIAKYSIEVQEQLRMYYALFYTFTPQKTKELYDQDKKLENLYQEALKDAPKKQIEIVHHLHKIALFIRSLTELRIDMRY
jgi:phosphate uptake regulator